MSRAIKLLPVIFLIFVLSTASVILITNFTGKIEIKDRVIRVERIIKVGEPIIDKLDKNVKEVMISKDWLSGVNYLRNKENLKDLYAKETLYPGDIIRVDRVGRMNQIVSLGIKAGYERIAVALEKPFNAVDYQMITGDKIALDCAVDNLMAKIMNKSFNKKILPMKDSQSIGYSPGNTSYTTSIRVIDSVNIISFCDKNGKAVSDEERQKTSNKDINSVILDVSSEDAMIIQMLRGNKAVFEITKLSKG